MNIYVVPEIDIEQIAVLTQQLEKRKKHRTLGDRVLQMIGFWVGIIYWLENMDRS